MPRGQSPSTACAATIVVVAACQLESAAFRLKTDAALEQRDRRLRGDLQQIERAVMRDFAGADREVHRRYATVLYTANITLAALALHDGDERTAVAFLQKAARAPASEELAYTDNLLSRPYRSLPVNLIQRGQHDVVTTFLERMAELNVARRGEFREAAAAIRRGDKPEL
jgi:hypothetical protein